MIDLRILSQRSHSKHRELNNLIVQDWIAVHPESAYSELIMTALDVISIKDKIGFAQNI